MPARLTKSTSLFIGGILNATGVFAGVDLYTSGPSIYGPSGSLDLYMSGLTVPSGTGYLNLYIEGDPLSFSGLSSITLYVKGQGESLTSPLYIKGMFSSNDFPFVGGSGIDGYLNMYLLGTGTNPAAADTVYSSGTKYLNLYIQGGLTGTSSGVNLFVNGSTPWYSNIPLYTYGVSGAVNTGLNLYCSGVGYSYSYADLFIRGY